MAFWYNLSQLELVQVNKDFKDHSRTPISSMCHIQHIGFSNWSTHNIIILMQEYKQ